MEALRPGALELSLAAAEDVIRERTALDENWRQRLERARTQAARTERQYQSAEPENRLVQRTLERRWEESLQEVRRMEEEYARFRQTQPIALTRREVEEIRELACTRSRVISSQRQQRCISRCRSLHATDCDIS